MNNDTRIKFNQIKKETASANQVQDVSEKFNLTPSVEQKLVEQMGESSDFLKQINIIRRFNL